MPGMQRQKKPEAEVDRVKLTARVTIVAYDAITDIQRHHRRKTGRHQPLWKIVDAAVKAYARQQGVEVGE